MKVPILLQIESLNAIKNDVNLESAHISFNISGSDNVTTRIKSGLEGARETFRTSEEISTDAEERGANSAALRAVEILNNTLLYEIQNSEFGINSWKFILVFDPRLTNIDIISKKIVDISDFGIPKEDIEWPFRLPIYHILNPFADNLPETRSFVYQGDNGARFEIKGTAIMRKPTMLLVATTALLLTVINFFV